MGLFRKRSAAVPDPHLPLALEQAERVRRMACEAFAAYGVTVLDQGDHVVSQQGTKYGLWNIAQICAGAPERDWWRLIADHVGVLVGAGMGGHDDLSDQALSERVFVRLAEGPQVRQHMPDAPIRELGESIVAVLAVDLPETIVTPGAPFWETRGGVDRWLGVGYDNTHLLVSDEGLRHTQVSPDGGRTRLDVVMGDSCFAGSAALFVPEVARRFAPDVPLSRGFLVAVPFRHQFAYAPVDPGPAAAQVLAHMFRFAKLGFDDAVAPVSPDVFLVRDGDWKQLTCVVDDQAQIHIDADVERWLGISQQ